ncbi:MAG: glycosyltransferase [Arcobacteraceae bacterium]
MPKISVIIPVYNVERYLHTCLASVIAQTFKDIEIICIDDASADDSFKIIKEFQSKDSRIIILQNAKNKGLGYSRNEGIKKAKGEYILFLDSDDFISSDLLEKTYALAQKENSDIVKFRNRRVQDNGTLTFIVSNIYQYGVEKTIVKDIISMKYFSAAWECLYKKTLLIENNLFFPNIYYEDIAIAFKLFYYAKKVSFSNEILYNWRQRKGSITRSITKKHIEDTFKVLDITYDFLIEQNCYEVYEKEFIERCVKRYNEMLKLIKQYSASDLGVSKKYFKYLENKTNQSAYFSENNIALLKNHNLFLFIRYRENQLFSQSYILSNQELKDNFYSTNIKLLREQIKTDEYLNQLQEKNKDCSKIATLKNKFHKKRCIIVGLGPSLDSLDSSILENEYTFCFSNFFTKLDKFTPTFYVGDESKILKNNAPMIDSLDIPYKLISSMHCHYLQKQDSIYHFNENLDYERILSPEYQKTNFSFEADKYLYKAATAAHLCMQLAYYLGFETVYLIGIDLLYDKPALTVNRDTTKEGVAKILEDFDYVKTIFENDGRKIYNLSSQSALKMFETVDCKTLQ